MPTSSEFKYWYSQLNNEQRQAVDAIEGPVMVIAGPGTGKTQILTLRIANILLKTDTPPEAILALTFTESGVVSMRQRLAQIVGPAAYRVAIATFHGYCNEIIRTHPDQFPHIIGAVPITDAEQVTLIERIINEGDSQLLRPFGSPKFYVRPVLSAIAKLKQEGVTPGRFAEFIAQEQTQLNNADDLYYKSGAHKGKMRGKYQEIQKRITKNRELAALYAEYQDTLRVERRYDYSDMIMEVLAALRADEDLRLMIQERTQYILVDEHQDTNNAQNYILELIASFHKNPNLFVVGDEKQAIFRFQGASLENFLFFKNLYADARIIILKRNYRSTQSIINLASSLIPGEVRLMAHFKSSGAPATLYTFDTPEMERYAVARDIQRRIANGASPDEIAVLYRENHEAFPIADMLSKLGVPCAIESDQNVLEDDDIRKLIALIRAICEYGDSEKLLHALHADFLQIEPLDLYKLSHAAWKSHKSVYDVLRSQSLYAEAGISSERLKELYSQLSHWHVRALNTSATPVFEEIVRDSGFLAHLTSHQLAFEKLAKLHALYDQLRGLIESHRNTSLAQFLMHLDTLQEHNLLIRSARHTISQGRVRLMTAHKSKGLEFDFVYVTGLIDGRWGNKRAVEHIQLPKAIFTPSKTAGDALREQDNDEERNLLYVSLTRARREVVVSYARYTGDGRERLPSQFLREINPDFIHEGNTAQFVRDLSTDTQTIFSRPVLSEPGIADKEFLNKLFCLRGLSATALNNYLECPWHYFYVNLVRIPEAPTKYLMYGIAVHEALNSFFNCWAESSKANARLLIRRFEQSLARQPMNTREYREALTKGRASLAGYYKEHHKHWGHNILNEFKIDGIELSPDVHINGKIDKIEIIDSANHAHIVDYKTGRPRTRSHISGTSSSADGNYKRQLVFYKLLLDHFASGKYHAETGEVSFIEPDRSGKYRSEIFEISADEMRDLERLIIHTAREILDLTFWNRTCGQWDCKYCALRAMMNR